MPFFHPSMHGQGRQMNRQLINLSDMTLIKSISGIRGTIGGAPGEGLSPLDIVKFTYAYCEKMRERRPKAE